MVSSAITGTAGIPAQDTDVKTAKSKNSGTDFSAVLSKSVAGNMSGSNKNNSSAMNITTAKKSDAASKMNTKDASTDNIKSDNSSKTKDVKADNTSKTDNKDVVSDKIDDAGSRIYDEIKKDFDVTDEQLKEAMETLGLTMADLLIPANITQLVVEVTGSQDAIAIVTDENLSANLMHVLGALDNELAALSSELDMPVEAVKEFIENADSGAAVAATEDETVTMAKNTDDVSREASDTAAVDNADAEDVSMSDVIARKLVADNDDSQGKAGTDDGRSSNTYGRGNDSIKGENAAVPAGSNIVNDIQNSFEAAFDNADYRVNAADVVDQIVESIKLNSTSELKSMEIQLNPQNLGKVNLLVSVREGVVTAQISAENEQVRKALESQVITLKENIESQGIKIDAVEITVQTNAFDSNQQFDGQKQEQAKKTSRRIRLDGFDYSDDEEEEEPVVNYNENSSVEYTA